MKIIMLILLYIISISALAQQKQYDIALSCGIYATPNFKQGQSKYYILTDFNYHLSKQWTVTSGFIAGQFNYYDDIRSNAYDEPTEYRTSTTNARGFDFHAYAMVKYSLVKTSRFYLQAGIGLGILTERLKYPYREPCSSGCAVFIGEQSSTTLELPIKAEINYLVTKQIGIGLTGGGFINPGLSNIGLHSGPQIRVSL